MQELESPTIPEMIKPQEQRRRRRRHSSRWSKLRRRIRRINYRLLLVVVISVAAVAAMGILVLVFNARSQVEDAWTNLNRILTRINNTPGTELTLADFERLQASVNELDQRLGSARTQIGFLRPFRFLSADLSLSLDALDAARRITQAARNMLNGMEPTLFSNRGREGRDSQPAVFLGGARGRSGGAWPGTVHHCGCAPRPRVGILAGLRLDGSHPICWWPSTGCLTIMSRCARSTISCSTRPTC